MKVLAARGEEGVAPFDADLLQRLEAIGDEARADHVDALMTLLCELAQGRVGVGLEPARAAEAALERNLVFLLLQSQALGQQACGGQALAVVRIAERQRARRQAMKAHQQQTPATLAHPVLLHARGQRADHAGVVVKLVHHAQLGHTPRAARPREQGVDRAAGGGRRVLRVQRQHQHARRALLLQRIERTGDRRLAVAHGRLHQHRMAALAERSQQPQRLLARPHPQRRTFVGPDRCVFGGRFRRPRAQHHAVQNRPPQQARDLDHARIGKELGEVAPHRLRRRRFGRAEVDQQDPGALGPIVRVRGLRGETHQLATGRSRAS